MFKEIKDVNKAKQNNTINLMKYKTLHLLNEKLYPQ